MKTMAIWSAAIALLGFPPSAVFVSALPAEVSADQAKITKHLEAGQAALRSAKYKKAIRAFSKALDQSDGASRMTALTGLAIAHRGLSQYKEALRYGEEALVQAQSPFDQASAENLIGTIHFEEYQAGDQDVEHSTALLSKAESCFRRALDLSAGQLDKARYNLATGQ